MSLLALFHWFEQTAIGNTIRQSHWLFPVIEAVHLLGLGFIGGAVLLVDLGLLGLGMGRKSVAQLSKDVEPWLIGSLAVMFATGIPLFLSESIKCLLQFCFLGEDGVAVLGHPFYVHGPASRDSNDYCAAVAIQIYSARLLDSLVCRRVGWTLDRVLLALLSPPIGLVRVESLSNGAPSGGKIEIRPSSDRPAASERSKRGRIQARRRIWARNFRYRSTCSA